MQHIETVTVGSGGAASITFSAIAADWTDLVLLCSIRTGVSSSGWHDILLRPNNDSGNATSRILYGNGSTAASFSESVINFRVSSADTTANTFGSSTIYIPNYSSSVAKSISIDTVGENNATAAYQGIHANLWNVTDPITSLVLLSTEAGNNLLEHTTVSLYGITAGSDGIVSVA